MNRELIIPNLHVILVHYPIGLFVAGLLIELLACLWRGSSLRTAGRWMILLGGLSMIPAALSGVYALHDVAVKAGNVESERWADIATASTLSADQWKQLVLHTWLMSGATAIIVTAIVSFLAYSDHLRRKLYVLTVGLLLIGGAAMASGVWFAGEAIYRFGVAITPPTDAATHPTTVPDAAIAKSTIETINTLLPPLQPHVIMAGVAIAFALAAVGLSIRQITGEPLPPPAMPDGEALVHSLNPPPPPVVVGSAKFFIVAAVFVVLTSLLGWYVFASDANTFKPKELWQMVSNPEQNNGSSFTRGVAHAAAGGALFVIPMIMAGLARWAPKQKLLLAVFTLLLIAVIAVQLWLGVLLLFDGSIGKISHFN